MGQFSHFTKDYQPHMVDISDKSDTRRTAVARAQIAINNDVYTKISTINPQKGDPCQTAKVAGIMAAKETAKLIPLCHNLNLEQISLNIELDPKQSTANLECSVTAQAKTGVEMEALVGVTIAAVTFYDMIKALDPKAVITKCGVYYKKGGKSKNYTNDALAW